LSALLHDVVIVMWTF